ncbi:hypothetical protein [Peptoclostridium litorale]|nr:hypothetical protein [Peptoclostridium litorale]
MNKKPIIKYIIKAHSASPRYVSTKSGIKPENRLDASPKKITIKINVA